MVDLSAFIAFQKQIIVPIRFSAANISVFSSKREFLRAVSASVLMFYQKIIY